MTDASDKPVSMLKKLDRTAKPAAPGSDAVRPTVIVALSALMVFAGLAAVAAAITLYGQHSYLVSTLTKSSYTPDSVVTSAADATGRNLTTNLGNLAGQTLTAAQKTTVANSAASALDKAVSKDGHQTSAQRSDQQTRVRKAVGTELATITGAVTTTDASTLGSTLTSTVGTNLRALQVQQTKDISSKADKIPSSQVIAGIVLTVALSFVAFGAYAGRYWARWAVPILWFLSSFTGTSAGFYSILQLGSSAPVGFKAASALSAVALIGAVILGFLRPSRAWFDAHKPATPAGGAQRRGLFAPRGAGGASTSRPSRRAPATRAGAAAKPDRASSHVAAATAANAAAKSAADRARTKKRTAAEATRNGAEIARSRAKTASKSRRNTES